MGGIEKVAPVLAGLFLVSGLAALGLPGLSPFVSEILVLIAAFQHHWWAGAIAVTAIVLAAFYVLWMYQRTMTGPDLVGGREARSPTSTGVRSASLAPLLLALVLFGFYPMPLLDVINPYVHDTLAARRRAATRARPCRPALGPGRTAVIALATRRLHQAAHRVQPAVADPGRLRRRLPRRPGRGVPAARAPLPRAGRARPSAALVAALVGVGLVATRPARRSATVPRAA